MMFKVGVVETKEAPQSLYCTNFLLGFQIDNKSKLSLL